MNAPDEHDCPSSADGRRCELAEGHEGMHVADFGDGDYVTWSDEGADRG